MDETVDILWSKVLERWDEDKCHQAFLQFCVEHQILAEAARKYRDIAEPRAGSTTETPDSSETPYRVSAGRRDDAHKRLAAITALAMATLDTSRTEPVSADKFQLYLRIFAALFFIAALLSLAWVFGTRPGAPD